jgi:ligand-binding sensor domain-containing protein
MRDGSNGGRVGVQQAYRDIGGVKGVDVKALAEGPDGAIWAGASAGIVRSLSSRSPAPFRLLTRAEGLIDRQINALATDRAGNMWAGTEGAGVMNPARRVHHVS